MPVLTLCMIVKNEEKYLRECLKSVDGIADEIVIVDTGSSDRTLEIAGEFGAKIYHFEWVNDFSAARNFALSKSTGRWILYLDADERLSAASVPELRQIIRTNFKYAFNCYVKSIDETNNTPNVMQYQRLFLNSRKLRFHGSIHEQIIESLKKENYKLFNSGIEIIHIGYNVSKEDLKVKARRNLEYLLNDYKKIQSVYNTFQLAQTYAVLENMDEAISYFRKVLEAEKCENFYKAHANRFIAAHLLARGDVKEAYGYALDGLKYAPEQPLLNYITSKIYLKVSDYVNSLKHCRIALENNKAAKPSQFEIFISSKAIIYLGLKTAVLCRDADYFNYFYTSLKQENEDEAANNALLSFVWILFNNAALPYEQMPEFMNSVDETNYEFLIALIGNYAGKEDRLRILENFPGSIKSKPDYMNAYALALYDAEKLQDAMDIFETLIQRRQEDASTVFYLISIYVALGYFDKVQDLITISEKKYENDPEILPRIFQLKENLKAYLV